MSYLTTPEDHAATAARAERETAAAQSRHDAERDAPPARVIIAAAPIERQIRWQCRATVRAAVVRMKRRRTWADRDVIAAARREHSASVRHEMAAPSITLMAAE